MAQDFEDIERNINVARDNLAATLDEIAERVNPTNVANRSKEATLEVLKQTSVQIGIGVVAVVTVGIIVAAVVLGRKK